MKMHLFQSSARCRLSIDVHRRGDGSGWNGLLWHWLRVITCACGGFFVVVAGNGGCGHSRTEVWQQQVLKPDLNATEFTDVVARAIREADPQTQVRVVGPLELALPTGTGSGACYLDNLWSESRHDPAIRVAEVTRHVQAVTSAMRLMAGDSIPDIDQVMPLVKGQAWLDEAKQQGLDVYHEPLVADLFVVYAEEGEQQLAYVNPQQARGFGLDTGQLRQQALMNLTRRLPKVLRHGNGPLYMIVAGGTYEASLLLADSVWESQADEVHGRMVVAVPSREIVMFTGEKSLEAIKEMKQTVNQIYAGGNYLISKTLLVRTATGWVPLDVADTEVR